MVTLQTIHASNNRLKDAGDGLVALFLGATSGIGQAVLKQFAQHAVKPRVYIVARNATATAPLVEELRRLNADGQYEVVEKNVSLIKETDEVAKIVKAKETKLDLLFMSVGFFSFDGRQGQKKRKESAITHMLTSLLAQIPPRAWTPA